MVRIEQVDNIWAKVHCEPSVAQELSDFFTFSIPNAHHSKRNNERLKYWDGKIRLFSIRTNQIYAGLIDYVVEFCKLNDYECVVSRLVSDLQDQIRFALPKRLPLEPRDYQLKATAYALKRGRGVIVSPTASGKSLIIYLIARNLLAQGKKQGLLIVPTTSLVEQMYGDFKEYGWDVEKNCQRVYYDSGDSRQPDKPMVISTWQSIYQMPKKYFKQFDFVIGDEAHGFKADSLKKIMTALVNCDYRIGTTGTLNSEKVNKLVLEGLFGTAKKFIDTKELIERKQLAELKVECIVLKHPEEECKKLRGAEYKDEIEYIISS